MALSIVNNSIAIGAQGSVNNANNKLAKTIKSLSTGLRINTAADDASGLAVSEKLRSQISGLSKAATNAQDAISLLQTAEGAMGSMTSMVQRIRELAVQAGDPAYTTNDRAMLQLEVDQLKEEIDRVSTSSEFNTKKLLNGDAAALWSSSSDDLEAIVKGAPAEGNYKLSYNVDPGQNSVYKSQIMKLGAGQMSYDINSNGTGIDEITNIKGMNKDENFEIRSWATSITGIDTAEVPNNMSYYKQVSASETITTSMTLYHKTSYGYEGIEVTIDSTTGKISIGDAVMNVTAGGTKEVTINGIKYTATTAVITITDEAGGFTLSEMYKKASATTTITDADRSKYIVISTANVSANAMAQIQGQSTILSTKSYDTAFNLNASNVTTLNSGFLEFEVLTDSENQNGENQNFKIRVRFRDASTGGIGAWEEITINTSGQTVTSGSLFSKGTNVFNVAELDGIKAGDKVLLSVDKGTALSLSDVHELKTNGTSYIGTVRTGGSAGASVVIPVGTNTDGTTGTIFTGQMDSTGNVYWGQIDVTFDKGIFNSANVTNGTNESASISLDILGEGDVASKYTKLSQLAQFTNADGRMVLDNTQEISIYAGNGKTAKIVIQGSDTIADLEKKFSDALIDSLGLGAPENGTNTGNVNSNLVKFVETAGTGDRAVQGTFVIQGAVLGDESNLTFVGDEGVLSALGIEQIQEATNSTMEVNVTDAHTGEQIGSSQINKVSDGILRNVIEGVDVAISPSSATNIKFNETNNKMEFTPKTDNTVAFLHIKDNATKAAVGANEGQTLDISIGRLDTKSMGIDGVNIATFDDAQKSITKLDMALEQISKARATAGAQMNRLEYTINNLNTTRENMVSAESRIRDLDIAQASSDLTAQQVVLQSATAMLAQANQIPSYAAQLLQA